MSLALWVTLLFFQSAAFTWASRARNSSNLWYHGIAVCFSNGIFFTTQFILIAEVAAKGKPLHEVLQLGALYILGSATGSVFMHWFSMRYLETGNRRVGA